MPSDTPLDLPPSVAAAEESIWFGAFVLSEAPGYRSREAVTIAQADEALPVGTFLMAGDAGYTKTDSPGGIAGILMGAVDTRAGPDRATALIRDAEVSDAYLDYGELDADEVNEHLRNVMNIIVRKAVLPSSEVATFAGQVATPAAPAPASVAAPQAASAPAAPAFEQPLSGPSAPAGSNPGA